MKGRFASATVLFRPCQALHKCHKRGLGTEVSRRYGRAIFLPKQSNEIHLSCGGALETLSRLRVESHHFRTNSNGMLDDAIVIRDSKNSDSGGN
jgi:hypothetical protein